MVVIVYQIEHLSVFYSIMCIVVASSNEMQKYEYLFVYHPPTISLFFLSIACLKAYRLAWLVQ